MFKGTFIAVIGATAYGFISLFTKKLVDLSVNSSTILVSRFFIISMVIGFYLVLSKRLVRPTKKQLLNLLFFGVLGYGGAIFLLAESYQYIPMGQATMIHFAYPLFVAMFMVVFYREKITWVKTAALGLTCLGIGFLMEFNLSYNLWGVFIALLSGAAFGLYMVSVSQSSIRDLDTFNLLFYLSVTIVLVFGVMGMLRGELQLLNLDYAVYSNMICVAGLSIVGIAFMTIAIRTIGPTYAAMISVFEPVVALLCGIVVYNESVTVYNTLGSFFMLVVILLIALEGYLKIKVKKKRKMETNEYEN
ncbi:MAG: DMT family transporter [Eubacterium sp.]